MNNPEIKFCPMLSQGNNLVPCNKNCKWYCDDGIPSRCAVIDISWTLSRIEKKLDDIYMAIPDDNN